MSEPKTFASLSSGLLARKGAARPAMRPQGFGQSGAGLDDLGWNDMGNDSRPAPAGGLSPMREAGNDGFAAAVPVQPNMPVTAPVAPSPVHEQHNQLADRLAAPVEVAADPLASFDDDFDADDALELDSIAPQPIAPFAHSTLRSADGAPVATPSPAPRRAAKPRSLPGARGKAAFTLRLDASRHLKLRLACAVSGRSAQMLVTDALDALLADMPEVDKMAERAPGRAAN